MDWFSPAAGFIVQCGSFALGVILILLIEQRKEYKIFENICTVKGFIALWLFCWSIGAIDFYIIHS